MVQTDSFDNSGFMISLMTDYRIKFVSFKEDGGYRERTGICPISSISVTHTQALWLSFHSDLKKEKKKKKKKINKCSSPPSQNLYYSSF